MRLDAFLYILLGTLPTVVAMLTGDEAAKFISPAGVFFGKWGIATVSAAAGSLKAFRSPSFARHIDAKAAEKAREDRIEEAQLTNRPNPLTPPKPIIS